MNIQSTTSMRIHFLNSLNLLLHHPYWHKDSLLYGVFAHEVAEFKGSVPRIRVVAFLTDEALPYLDKAKTIREFLPALRKLEAKLSVEPVFWDILSGGVWGDEPTSLFEQAKREEGQDGVLSEFGERCVEALFNSFDINGSGDLDFQEINALLRATGNRELDSVKEYKAIISEERLHSKNWRMTLEGLKRLYSKALPENLAKDAAEVSKD